VGHRIALCFASFLLFGYLLDADHVTAQTIGYRQTNLASNVPNVAKNATPGLVNPWGIAFLSGQPFFTADNKDGRATSLDATGFNVSPGAFIVRQNVEIAHVFALPWNGRHIQRPGD
jgi:hypothetical protein